MASQYFLEFLLRSREALASSGKQKPPEGRWGSPSWRQFRCFLERSVEVLYSSTFIYSGRDGGPRVAAPALKCHQIASCGGQSPAVKSRAVVSEQEVRPF